MNGKEILSPSFIPLIKKWKTYKSASFIIVVLNILFYIYFNTIISPEELYEYRLAYSLNPESFNSPIAWISNMFLHGSLLHLFVNLSGLFILGIIVESEIESGKFILLYLISGLMASLFTYVYLVELDIAQMILGSSGAIFGVWAFFSYIYKEMKAFIIQFLVFHVTIIFFDLGVAWFAHLGGAVGGLLLAIIYMNQYSLKKKAVDE